MAVIEAIQSLYLESDVTTVTMDGIPGTYEHLQLRFTHRNTYPTTGTGNYMRFGSTVTGIDTGPNYNGNWMYGGTSSAADYRQANQNYIELQVTGTHNRTSEYMACVMNIYDYANTNKNTAFEWFNNKVPSASYYMMMGGGFWNSAFAVDRISWIQAGSYDLQRGSEITIYGIKSS